MCCCIFYATALKRKHNNTDKSILECYLTLPSHTKTKMKTKPIYMALSFAFHEDTRHKNGQCNLRWELNFSSKNLMKLDSWWMIESRVGPRTFPMHLSNPLVCGFRCCLNLDSPSFNRTSSIVLFNIAQ